MRPSVVRKRRASTDIRALAAEVGLESPTVNLHAPHEYTRQQFDGLVSELRASPQFTADQRERLNQVVLVYNGEAIWGRGFISSRKE